MSFCPNFSNSKIITQWHWFGRLIHHYLTTGGQFSTNFPKIFPMETILDFFKKKKKKLDNRGQDILRQNQAEICLDFSSQCCKEKKIGLGCQKVPIS